MNVLDTLTERGFIERTTHDEELRAYLDSDKVTCYIGFDPTAASLHVGSLVPIMSLVHMQRCGCRPIALVGGGTGLIGDPSGKTEMRRMLTPEAIETNAAGIKRQLSRFISFEEGKALLLNNAEWLVPLSYIPFLRDIGRHFSVNRMIKAESCRLRLDSEEGLSFLEFNYMILQAYDFLELFSRYDCRLQMGGSDQWGNIVAGIDLVRRQKQGAAFGITFPLMTTASGAKMGKTAQGAVWLDAEKTSPYDYYQYWRNSDDRDVARFLALFTLLPMAEIKPVEAMVGDSLNSAKVVLAFEATAIAHGQKAALQAFQAAAQAFGQTGLADDLLPSSAVPRGKPLAADASIPASNIDRATLQGGMPAFQLFRQVGLCASGGEARRLIKQGGAYLNGERISAFDRKVGEADLVDGKIVLRAGRKKYHQLNPE
jgi:tyrosyl-tRNA synthetase